LFIEHIKLSVDSTHILLAGTISIRVIGDALLETDIPVSMKSMYKCIYLPNFYVEKPFAPNQRKRDTRFFDKNIEISQLYEMVQ
jgi:hypothetical protein